MADTTRAVACNDTCGCPSPCPGGEACSCRTIWQSSGGEGDGHNRCSCGEHCGCNPCTCPRSEVTSGVGRAYCKCGDACTCATCSS
ncbi:hypothetical protein K2173_010436 [Erythroxylum novogranatense]|uniref:Uncharacterized protein n=1 Tax=Erythroxylum novogranatense TaxID=1862640 RepID=A0AAV8TEV6_9ROSI|nr:hypothetical protein K2173_010436 [Erythroxylum novogranatense]